ncbi:MAG: 23S rRNA (guanosine(2251)-2'-O)-methyltransferase RlmB [Anaerolineales bacterium]
MEILAGRNSVYEALRAARRPVRRVLVARGARERGTLAELLSLATEHGVPIDYVDRSELDRAAGGLYHQGVVAQAAEYPYATIDEMLLLANQRQEQPLLLALDGVQDPQNVGTLLRTAEAVGVHGVLLPQRRSAHVTPAVSRASAGAVEHLRIALVTNLVRALQELQDAGVWAVGVEAHPAAIDYASADLNLPLVLVLGGEGEGMHRLVAERCDLLIRLPMYGRINSLNVAVAGSIALYQAALARRPHP